MAALGRSLRLRVLASGALLFLCQGFGMSLITYLYAIDDASSPFVSLEAATGLSATEYALLVGYINGGAGLLSGLTLGGAGVRPGVRIFLCSAGARRSRSERRHFAVQFSRRQQDGVSSSSFGVGAGAPKETRTAILLATAPLRRERTTRARPRPPRGKRPCSPPPPNWRRPTDGPARPTAPRHPPPPPPRALPPQATRSSRAGCSS